jgi:hypothetical protein
MNCKQGDLAFIVNGTGARFKPEPENVGRVVRCVRLVPIVEMGPVWQIAAEGSPLYVYWNDQERDMERTALMEDTNLRPIKADERITATIDCLTAGSDKERA